MHRRRRTGSRVDPQCSAASPPSCRCCPCMAPRREPLVSRCRATTPAESSRWTPTASRSAPTVSPSPRTATRPTAAGARAPSRSSSSSRRVRHRCRARCGCSCTVGHRLLRRRGALRHHRRHRGRQRRRADRAPTSLSRSTTSAPMAATRSSPIASPLVTASCSSLCDHDLYVGIGQPYPHNPYHDDTVDGLLANLAMVDAVSPTAPRPCRRATSSLWTAATAPGSAPTPSPTTSGPRGVAVDGSCSTPACSSSAPSARMGTSGSRTRRSSPSTGPTSPTGACGSGDRRRIRRRPLRHRRGERRPVPRLRRGGRLYVAARWSRPSDQRQRRPVSHEVHVYPGSTHMATTQPGTQVQNDLRAWYRLVAHSRNTDRTDLSHSAPRNRMRPGGRPDEHSASELTRRFGASSARRRRWR